jgi:glycosyltransferase involved in cell wall biosynthesis
MNSFPSCLPASEKRAERRSERPLRIVLFMFDFELTGVVLNAVRLANALADRGHDVGFLVCRQSGLKQHRIDPRINIVVEPGIGGRTSRAIALFLAIAAIRRRLLSTGPDILLSVGNHGHLPALAAAWGISGLRRVLRISNEPDHADDGPLLRALRNLSLRIAARSADRLLLVSPRLARHRALRRLHLDGRAVVTANGICAQEVRTLSAEPCNHPWLECDEALVVTVGRLARQKNLATLVRAIAIANRQKPVNLLIIGRGSTVAKKRLRELASQLGIGARVELTGQLANPYPFMRAATAFVLPSLWEGRSNVLLEAMACGVPIVASRTAGDAEELLCYGRFGLLVDPSDAEAMAQAISWQVGKDACRPAGRVEDFDQRQAVDLICTTLTETSGTGDPRPHRTSILTGRRGFLRATALAGLLFFEPGMMSIAARQLPIRLAATKPQEVDETTSLKIGPIRDLDVLTFNVAGLPWPIAGDRTEAMARIGVRLAELRKQGRAPQVVVLQEAFISEAQEIGRLAGYRFRAFGPSNRTDPMAEFQGGMQSNGYRLAPALLSGGLAIFSDYELLDIRRAAFPVDACAGLDCLANKGVLAARLSIPGLNGPVEIVTTHLNSNRASGVPEQFNFFAYRRQLQALDSWLARFGHPGSLRIIAGDFNLGQSDRRLAVFLGHLERWRVQPVAAMGRSKYSRSCAAEPAICKGPVALSSNVPLIRAKDWQMYHAGGGLQVAAVSREVLFTDAGTHRLSDHIGYSVKYRLVAGEKNDSSGRLSRRPRPEI